MTWKFLYSWVSWRNWKEEARGGVSCVVGKDLMCVTPGGVRSFLWGEGWVWVSGSVTVEVKGWMKHCGEACLRAFLLQ